MKPGFARKSEGRTPRGAKLVGTVDLLAGAQLQQAPASTLSSLTRKKSMRGTRSSMLNFQLGQDEDSPLANGGNEADQMHEKELEERITKLRDEVSFFQHRLEFEGAKAAANAEKLTGLQTTLDGLLAQADEYERHHQSVCDVFQQRIDALTQQITTVQHDTAALRQSLSSDTAEDAEQLVLVAANLRANQIQNFVLNSRDRDLMTLTEAEIRELNVRSTGSHAADGSSAGHSVSTKPVTSGDSSDISAGSLRVLYDKMIFGSRDPEGFGELFGQHDGQRWSLANVLDLHNGRLVTTVMNAFAADFVEAEEALLPPEESGTGPVPRYPHALNL